MDKKHALEVAVLMVIGLAFIFSYAAYLGPGAGTQTSSTTVALVPQTVFAYGSANAAILNYSSNLHVNVTCGNASQVLDRISNITSRLEANGSVINTFSSGDTVLVQAGSIGAKGFYAIASNELNQSELSCTTFSGSADVELPQAVNLTVASTNQLVPIPLSQQMRGYALSVDLGYGGNYIRVSVKGLIESNGTVYQIGVTQV